MFPIRTRLTISGALFFAAAAPALAAPRVAVDIPPVHSVVARIMAGVGAPGLLVPPGASPHGYALRPSDAALLENAEVVIWIGPDLTPWMAGPIEALAPSATVLAVEDVPGVELLPVRAGGPFEAHGHADERPEAEHHDPAAEREHHDEDGEAEHHDHDQHEHASDGHIWLDPLNATAFAQAVAETLVQADPENAAAYTRNAAEFGTEMTALIAAIEAELAPARGKPFIVFHDAFQYFEKRFDFPAAGSISLHGAEAPSATRVAEIRDRVIDEGVVCAFTEPQFEPKLLRTVIEGASVRTGVLDPDAGTDLAPGQDLYPAMLLRLASSLANCLAP